MRWPNIYTGQKRYSEAENVCRHLLTLNPNDTVALNLLAQALRLQGRVKDSQAVTAQVLAKAPNDSFGHETLGFLALQEKDHVRARDHFLEALRLDPYSASARKGLLLSLEWRNPIVAVAIKLAAASGAPKNRENTTNMALIGVIQLLAALGGRVIETKTPLYPLEAFAAVMFFPALLWFFGRYVKAIADLFLMFDSGCKYVLSRKEKVSAVIPVLGLAAAISVLFLVGAKIFATVILLGTGFLAATIAFPLWRDCRKHEVVEKVID